MLTMVLEGYSKFKVGDLVVVLPAPPIETWDEPEHGCLYAWAGSMCQFVGQEFYITSVQDAGYAEKAYIIGSGSEADYIWQERWLEIADAELPMEDDWAGLLEISLEAL